MVFKTVAIKTKSKSTKGGNGMNISTTQRKQTLENNIKVGKFCEKVAKKQYANDGWEIIPASYGYDFLAVKEIPDGVKLTEHVEVKAGDAKLSKLQVATMHKCRREGKSYRVFRVNSNYIDEHINKEPDAVMSCDDDEHLQMQDTAPYDRFKKTVSRILGLVNKFRLKKFGGVRQQHDTSGDEEKIILLGGQITSKYCIFLIWGTDNNG
jgi:hypothetical protein